MSNRRALVCWILLALGTLALYACGTEARHPGPAPGPIETLGSIGSTLSWVGGIGTAIGVAGAVVAFFNPSLAWIGALCRIGASGGAGVLGLGLGVAWIAAHPWIAALGVATVCAGFAYFHRRDIAILLGRFRAGCSDQAAVEVK